MYRFFSVDDLTRISLWLEKRLILTMQYRKTKTGINGFALLRNVALAVNFAWLSGASTTAHAGMVCEIANLNQANNTLEVTLKNDGTKDVKVAGFSFEITTTRSDLIFTDVTTATSGVTYIFDGYSLFGPNINLPVSPNHGETISAADNDAIPNDGTMLAQGQTLGLGLVSFFRSTADPVAREDFFLSPYPDFDVSGPQGNSYVVPEPATITSLLIGTLGVLLASQHRRRVAKS